MHREMSHQEKVRLWRSLFTEKGWKIFSGQGKPIKVYWDTLFGAVNINGKKYLYWFTVQLPVPVPFDEIERRLLKDGFEDLVRKQETEG